MNMLLEEFIKHKAELYIHEKESKSSNAISSSSWDDILLSIKSRRSKRSNHHDDAMNNGILQQRDTLDNKLPGDTHTVSSATSST